MKWSELSGKKIGLWGMGKEGQSSRAALLKHVPDAQLIEIGEENLQNLYDCQIIVKSPGVCLYRPEVTKLHEMGIAITSNTNLYMSNKGLNLPDTDFGGDILTEKDIADIE